MSRNIGDNDCLGTLTAIGVGNYRPVACFLAGPTPAALHEVRVKEGGEEGGGGRGGGRHRDLDVLAILYVWRALPLSEFYLEVRKPSERRRRPSSGECSLPEKKGMRGGGEGEKKKGGGGRGKF